MKRSVLVWSACLWFGIGCAMSAERSSQRGSNSAPSLDSAAAQSAGFSIKDARDARKLYSTKCMRCHKSYEPADYPAPQWDSWMTRMRRKARLTPEQDRLLSRYLDAYRSSAAVARTNVAEASTPSVERGR